jgi:hypothetical protein
MHLTANIGVKSAYQFYASSWQTYHSFHRDFVREESVQIRYNNPWKIIVIEFTGILDINKKLRILWRGLLLAISPEEVKEVWRYNELGEGGGGWTQRKYGEGQKGKTRRYSSEVTTCTQCSSQLCLFLFYWNGTDEGERERFNHCHVSFFCAYSWVLKEYEARFIVLGYRAV